MDIAVNCMSPHHPTSSTFTSESVKALWQNERYRAKQHKARLGRIQSEYSRAKGSATIKKKWQDPQFRADMLAILQSKEYREKISKAMKGRKLSNETKRKMSLAKTNFRNSDESKIKMSVSHKGLRQSETSKLKISATMKSYVNNNPEVRERLATLGIGRIATPETRIKLRNANLGKRHTEKTKAKLRELRLKQIIPVKDTLLEIKFQNALLAHEVRYQKHVSLLGQPDIFIPPNICIFLDGCYWHACPICNIRASEKTKIKRERDANITSRLVSWGYKVIRFWGHEVEENIDNCIALVKNESELVKK